MKLGWRKSSTLEGDNPWVKMEEKAEISSLAAKVVAGAVMELAENSF
jgi:hypothetical protein